MLIEGKTALDYAIEEEYTQIVEYLKQKGKLFNLLLLSSWMSLFIGINKTNMYLYE